MSDNQKFLDKTKYDTCRIFIASPTDVQEERKAVDDVVADWNAIHSERECCMLQTIKYDRNLYADTGNHPQKVIDEKYLAKRDFLVGIFWSKIGASTPDFKSGTIEEITKHCKDGKQGVIYFSQKPYNLKTQKELTEKGKVLKFQNSIKKESFYKDFSSVDEFKYKLYKDLEQHILGHNPKYVQDQSLPLSVPTDQKEKSARISGGSYAGEQKTLPIKGVEYTFRWCPAGSFWMGSPEVEKGRGDDESQHNVTLSRGFWLLETPVTQRLWKDILGSNPSYFEGENRPVENVDWYDSQEFIANLNKEYSLPAGYKASLPTEAQWEYACRADRDGVYGGTGKLEEMGWYYGNSSRETHEVKQKAANAWGLYDMHGNVREWCSDWYGGYQNGNVIDPEGPTSGSRRVYRGGSWYGFAMYCRSAFRDGFDPILRSDDLGFRVALVPRK